MRTLASIVQVEEVKPIAGADFIEMATLKGKAWQCVIKKGDLKASEYGVFMEIDSFLPEEPRYEFLRKGCYREMNGVGGFRLRTIALRKQISQGLLLPLEDFEELRGYGVGFDATELLGVKLYEPPLSAQLSGEVKGSFPSWLHNSEQPRIQNFLEYFDTMKGVGWERTLKMDGSSLSLYCRDGEFGVCSRTRELKETEGNTFWEVARRLDMEERMCKLNRNLMVQAELCGEGIQSNRCKLKGHNMFVYDIFDIDKYAYLCKQERLEIMDKLNQMPGEEIQHVPIIDDEYVFDRFEAFDELHAWVTSVKGYNGTSPEGVVFKALLPVDGHIISFKVINNKYLLKHNE